MEEVEDEQRAGWMLGGERTNLHLCFHVKKKTKRKARAKHFSADSKLLEGLS